MEKFYIDTESSCPHPNFPQQSPVVHVIKLSCCSGSHPKGKFFMCMSFDLLTNPMREISVIYVCL